MNTALRRFATALAAFGFVVLATPAALAQAPVKTEGGVMVSNSAVYPFTVSSDRNLVASFVPQYTVATSASPWSTISSYYGPVPLRRQPEHHAIMRILRVTRDLVPWLQGSPPTRSPAPRSSASP